MFGVFSFRRGSGSRDGGQRFKSDIAWLKIESVAVSVIVDTRSICLEPNLRLVHERTSLFFGPDGRYRKPEVYRGRECDLELSDMEFYLISWSMRR